MKKLCTLLLALALLFSLSATAYADGKVSYEGQAEKFIFSPGTEQSPTSLFENFQGVMPGDSLTEQIVIRNRAPGKKINVYMRALGAQLDTEDFLSQLRLTVKLNDSSTIFDAPADETAQLTDWVFLGTLRQYGKATLDVTLEVPITMGNDYMNRIGYLDWEFKVEEFSADSPQTGDESNIALMCAAMLLSFGAAAAVIGCIKKDNKRKSTR